MALALVIGGVAACGSDDGVDNDAVGDGIAGYCTSVHELADKTDELEADPSNAALRAEVADAGESVVAETGNFAGGLEEFNEENQDAFTACQDELEAIDEVDAIAES
jgi:hypothetical protein